jgi:hypothetical protein
MPWSTIIGILIFIIILIIVFTLIGLNADKIPSAKSIAVVTKKATEQIRALPQKIFKGYSDATNRLPNTDTDKQSFLVNYHIIGESDTGYVGGDYQNGVFNGSDGIKSAVFNGSRLLVLNIEDYDGVAYLIARGEDGTKYSLNAGKLSATFNSLSSMFEDSVDARTNYLNNDPVIMYLRFPKNKISKACAEFVAEKLGAIRHLLLNKNEVGDFTKRAGEKHLVQLSPSLYSRKIIVVTNIDTAAFDGAFTTKGIPNLHYYINGLVYKHGEPLDAAVQPVFYETNYNNLDSLTDDGKELKAMARSAFFIVLGNPNPTKDSVDKAFKFGLQGICAYNLKNTTVKSAFGSYAVKPKAEPLRLKLTSMATSPGTNTGANNSIKVNSAVA